MKLTPELIRKHRGVIESTVKAHTSHSKAGKAYTVRQYDRTAVAGKITAKIAQLRNHNNALADLIIHHTGTVNKVSYDKAVRYGKAINKLKARRAEIVGKKKSGYGYTIGDQSYRHGQG